MGSKNKVNGGMEGDPGWCESLFVLKREAGKEQSIQHLDKEYGFYIPSPCPWLVVSSS